MHYYNIIRTNALDKQKLWG